MWWHFVPPLASVQFGATVSVHGESFVRIDGHAEKSGVSLNKNNYLEINLPVIFVERFVRIHKKKKKRHFSYSIRPYCVVFTFFFRKLRVLGKKTNKLILVLNTIRNNRCMVIDRNQKSVSCKNTIIKKKKKITKNQILTKH